MVETTIFIALFAGLLTFLSPCVLPLVPAFLSYLAGISAHEMKGKKKHPLRAKHEIIINTIFFVLGFSIIFAIAGVIINSFFAGMSADIRIWLGRIGGTVIIIFALYLLKIIKLPFLENAKRFHAKQTKYAYLTSFIFGSTFAISWTPCIGAILGSILTLAIVQPVNAFFLLLAYAVGLSVPFLLVGSFTAQATKWIAKADKVMKWVTIIAGIILLILGISVFTNTLNYLANFDYLFTWLGLI